MKINRRSVMGSGKRLATVLMATASLWVAATGWLQAAVTNTNAVVIGTNGPSAANVAWLKVEQASKFPKPPTNWSTNKPSAEEMRAFYLPVMLRAADAAKNFYLTFPDDSKAAEAQSQEYMMLKMAVYRLGDTNSEPRFAALQKNKLNDDKLSAKEKMKVRLDMVASLLQDLPENEKGFTNAVAQLKQDFPSETNIYQIMAIALPRLTPATGAIYAKELIASSDVSERLKDQARAYLKQADMLGKPVAVQFTAFDGRAINLADMKGKVVLVDFWATWCGPCMGELPNVKAAYAKLHGQGFEIVGISFDQDKDALAKTLKDREMTWAQYFDGAGWENKYGKEFGIHSIPTMWLIGKDGRLRDLEAREELAEKVTKLLAEK